MHTTHANSPEDGTGLIALDAWLEPYAHHLRKRHVHYRKMRAAVDATGGLLGPISTGHHYFGFNRGFESDSLPFREGLGVGSDSSISPFPGADRGREREVEAGKPGVWYREWAPGARRLSLTGDFNGWDRAANPLQRDEWGVWSIFLPDEVYARRLVHGSLVKVNVAGERDVLDRIPAYARRVLQDPKNRGFTAQFWMPPDPYVFAHETPRLPEGEGPRIYEAHVGMAQEEGRVGTFDEFTRNILPRIEAGGYNVIQLMAVMEHPYYGSFGYHVSNFYAVSSWFGTPDDLKRLVDAAHGRGMLVLLDLIHSHSIKNVNEGLSHLDGTDYQYFHAGPRGVHAAWDSLLFDYSRYEVQRFLLSNVRYWLEEFRFDGFRFDGVTSMMYRDHGLGRVFATYDDYYGANIDDDAVGYLQLANELAHAVKPGVVTIAEEVSGMPGIARPVSEGGLGFDYRLAMGVPDYWIKLIKELPDESWDLNAVFRRLLDRRYGEKHVGYAESHDQALVGDQSLAFRLMDQAMYWHMNLDSKDIVVDRGVALHKMIRLITFSLAGDAYLNFMGNEFGHPEWVDFPREGNGYSFHYARRQWSLVDSDLLRYRGLNEFDQAMNALDKRFHLLTDPFIEQMAVNDQARQLVYHRGPLVFVFNFHANQSYMGLRIPVPEMQDYRVVLDSDAPEFSGHGRSGAGTAYPVQQTPMNGWNQSAQIYLPSRSAQVLAPARLLP